METIQKNKTAAAMIVLAIVAFFAYNTFFNSGESLQTAVLPVIPDDRLVKLSDELSRINFKKDIFNTAGYLYLVDFSTPLQPQPVGRPNPFDIIGR